MDIVTHTNTHARFVGRAELSQECSVLQKEKHSYLPSFARVVTSRECTLDCTCDSIGETGYGETG